MGIQEQEIEYGITTKDKARLVAQGLCARYQSNLKESHLTAVKRIPSTSLKNQGDHSKEEKYSSKDLMNSLSRRYERIKKIPKELGIQLALRAHVPEQAPS
ncbi:hypothetical protein Tco_0480562 [Tanacetum coccineum]